MSKVDASAPSWYQPEWWNEHGEIMSWRRMGIAAMTPQFYPYVLLTVLYVILYIRPSLLEWLCVFGVWFVLAMCALTANHRYFSHQAFKTSRAFRFVIAIASCLGMQFGPVWWSSKHRRHHKNCDTKDDPHSWKQTSFLYAWLGWVLTHEEKDIDLQWVHPSMQVKDSSGRKVIAPELLLLDKLWFVPFLVVNLLLFSYGVSVRNIITFYIAPSLMIPTPILLFNVIFHPPTAKAIRGCYAIDNAADVLSLLLGEAHHEDHHAHPSRSHRPGGVDLSWYLLLKPLSLMGLIWDLK